MSHSIKRAGALAFLFSAIAAVNCYNVYTARDMLVQDLCVCPCGNPEGGKLYHIPQVNHNWFNAVAYCNAIGMSIASIEDASQRQQLGRFLSMHRYNRNTEYWIGANTLTSARQLIWGLSQRQVKQPEWDKDVGPNFDRSKPFCVSINGYTMSWYGRDCEQDQKQFICEF